MSLIRWKKFGSVAKRPGQSDRLFLGAPARYVIGERTYNQYTPSYPVVTSEGNDAYFGVGNSTHYVRTGVSSVAGRGNVLEQRFAANNRDGIAMAIPLSRSVNEATIEYDVRFVGVDWVSTSNTGSWGSAGKLPGLGGILPGAGINPPTGGNPDSRGWTGRGMWRTNGTYGPRPRNTAINNNEWVSYIYDPTQAEGNYGQDRWTGSSFKINTWHTVTQYYKMNTIAQEGVAGNADGVHRMYFDGVLVYENTSQIYKIYADAKITHLMWSVFYGGADNTWAAPSDSIIQFDNLSITTPEAP